MKLAEALLVRAEMQKKLASLRERIGRYAVVQDGDKPHEDPGELIKESFAIMGELKSLIFRINQSNHKHTVADGRTLTEAIADRDTLASRHALLQHAIASTQKEPDRYSMAEIKWVATMKVSSLQKQSDDLAGKLREINSMIQEANWQAVLVE